MPKLLIIRSTRGKTFSRSMADLVCRKLESEPDLEVTYHYLDEEERPTFTRLSSGSVFLNDIPNDLRDGLWDLEEPPQGDSGGEIPPDAA